MHDPIIEGKYRVTGYTQVILNLVEHKEDEIHWTFNMSISTAAGEPTTLKEEMTRQN